MAAHVTLCDSVVNPCLAALFLVNMVSSLFGGACESHHEMYVRMERDFRGNIKTHSTLRGVVGGVSVDWLDVWLGQSVDQFPSTHLLPRSPSGSSACFPGTATKLPCSFIDGSARQVLRCLKRNVRRTK